jgi:hypothetical protein
MGIRQPTHDDETLMNGAPAVLEDIEDVLVRGARSGDGCPAGEGEGGVGGEKGLKVLAG